MSKRKLAATVDVSAAKRVTPVGGVLTVQKHPELPAGAKLRLRPLVRADNAGNIAGIQVCGRTPSPFGAAMGDHTVAWRAIIDSVTAQLYRLPVSAAIRKLAELQAHAEGWMTDPDSDGMKLLGHLGLDLVNRSARLEDAAAWFEECRASASAAVAVGDQPKALLDLGRAIGWHLAYQNYLPFATVPARSATGSHGSGEAHYRKRLVDYERLSDDDKAALPKDPAQVRLREALWKLLDLAAALRASGIERALNPAGADAAQADVRKLAAIAASLEFAASKLPLNLAAQDKVREASKSAKAISTGDQDDSVKVPARRVMERANSMLNAAALSSAKQRTRVPASAVNAKLAADQADLAAQRITELFRAAPERAALVLARVLHEHQRVVAAAYPGSVTRTAFLDPDPASAATDKLVAELGIDPAGRSDKSRAFAAVLQEVERLHQAMTPVPAAGAASGWVAESSADPLVVSWDPRATPPISVDGRAEAPTGVAGMGSHTTAWKVEVGAVNVIAKTVIGKAATAGVAVDDENVMSALADAIDVDLASSLMELAPLLPADQIAAGQLVDLFNAATAATNAADVGSAAKSFLEFRNRLPFATVDAGSRAGHGEGSSNKEEDLFDGESLQEAAELVEAALRTAPGRKEAAAALTSAARLLEVKLGQDGSKDADQDSEREEWGEIETIRKAVENTVERLDRRAAALLTPAPSGLATVAAGTGDRIINLRLAEHHRVWTEVYG